MFIYLLTIGFFSDIDHDMKARRRSEDDEEVESTFYSLATATACGPMRAHGTAAP